MQRALCPLKEVISDASAASASGQPESLEPEAARRARNKTDRTCGEKSALPQATRKQTDDGGLAPPVPTDEARLQGEFLCLPYPKQLSLPPLPCCFVGCSQLAFCPCPGKADNTGANDEAQDGISENSCVASRCNPTQEHVQAHIWHVSNDSATRAWRFVFWACNSHWEQSCKHLRRTTVSRMGACDCAWRSMLILGPCKKALQPQFWVAR